MQVAPLNVGQDEQERAAIRVVRGRSRVWVQPDRWRDGAIVCVAARDRRERQLFDVVRTLHAGSGFADFLDRGEQQANQDCDDGDDDQQLDQRKCRTAFGRGIRPRHDEPPEMKVERISHFTKRWRKRERMSEEDCEKFLIDSQR